MNHRSFLSAALLVAFTVTGSGCVSFTGPRDLRVELEGAGNVTLHEEEGVCVGALVIGVANLVAAPYLPVSLDGVSTVDYGEYRVETACDVSPLCLRELELPGWVPFLRVRDQNRQMVAMVEEEGASVRALLFLEQSGDRLQVVRARGDFDRIIENLMSSELLIGMGDDMVLMGLTGDP